MTNFKEIFSLDYHPKLIKNMAEATIAGAFAANILIASASAFILYDFLPHMLIFLWMFLHTLIFIGRVFVSRNLLRALETPHAHRRVRKYLLLSLSVTSLTAILYGVIISLNYFYEVPDLTILLMSTIVIIMAASSISTLGSVILSFILFVFFSVAPLIIFALLHGEGSLMMLAFVSLSYILLHMLFGYRQYVLLRNTVFLEETFSSIYEKSSDGIVLIKKSRFYDCNQSTLKMFGCPTKEAFLTVNLSRLMPKYQPDGRRSIIKMVEMVNRALENGTHSFEWLHQKKEGELFWTEIVLTKITLDAEVLLHGVWRDINDRKKLEVSEAASKKEIEMLNQNLAQRVKEEVGKNREKEQQFIQQSRLAQMGEMISMIAHQWRQPLSAISATSSLLELKAKLHQLDDDSVEQKAKDISSYAQHLSHTIDDFRDFFQPNRELKETSYEEIITSVLSIIESSIVNKNIQLIQELNTHEILTTYPNELKQVVLNLIKNAEDVLLEREIDHPYIKIRTYTKDDQQILEISDNGGGIPETLIEKIFDPYFSTKSDKNGTGLGLYMSKTIIEEHCGGTLHVKNGIKGARFEIILLSTVTINKELQH
ncbi:MAG: hypothetical protein DRG24_01900 [Epsilonproteobacteria bacterium]|nr:MAG: hypothetical protein DRG24_01900 [Campylobacterota bacterium]